MTRAVGITAASCRGLRFRLTKQAAGRRSGGIERCDDIEFEGVMRKPDKC